MLPTLYFVYKNGEKLSQCRITKTSKFCVSVTVNQDVTEISPHCNYNSFLINRISINRPSLDYPVVTILMLLKPRLLKFARFHTYQPWKCLTITLLASVIASRYVNLSFTPWVGVSETRCYKKQMGFAYWLIKSTRFLSTQFLIKLYLGTIIARSNQLSFFLVQRCSKPNLHNRSFRTIWPLLEKNCDR